MLADHLALTVAESLVRYRPVLSVGVLQHIRNDLTIICSRLVCRLARDLYDDTRQKTSLHRQAQNHWSRKSSAAICQPRSHLSREKQS